MTGSPFHATPATIGDQIHLRIHTGRDFKVDVPLRPRQALVLATQLLNLALAADVSAARPDGSVLKTPGEQDIAIGKRAHG